MGAPMLYMLENLQKQEPAIHDLKFSFDTDIHKYLKEMYAVNPKNNGIKLPIPSLDEQLILKVMVYPKKLQLDIGCSYKPFVYDLSGTLNLCCILGQILYYLRMISSHDAQIPSISSWIITHYHFGKDGSEVWLVNHFT